MNLPYLKSRRTPRIAPPMEEVLVQGSPSDHINEQMLGELISSYEDRDVKLFRHALEALILNMLAFEGADNEHAGK